MHTGNHDEGSAGARGEPRAAVRSVVVGPQHAGRRLDNYLLSLLKGAPRRLIYKLVRSGQVRVNGKRARPDQRLAAGDAVRVPPVEEAQAGAARIPAARVRDLEHAIVHEDERVIVLDKPAGLACHAGSGLRYGVIEIMRMARPRLTRLDLAHRLDRDTSGCLMLCKDLETLRAVNGAFLARTSRKRYVALLRGRLGADRTRIDATLDIERDRRGERSATVADSGKPAQTLIEACTPCGPHSLVTLRLLTGRMHQIRAHARHIGHPVAGDTRYGAEEFNTALAGLGLERLFLHAAELEIALPDGYLTVSAPLPAALQQVIARLERQHGHA